MVSLRRRILDYSLAGFLLLVPAAILYANAKNPNDLNAFDEAVLRVSSPLQSGAAWVIGGVGGAWDRYLWLVDVEEENRELRSENQRLRRELATAQRRSVDTEDLEHLVGLKRRTAAETIGARVIAASINSYFRVVRVRLDRGESEVVTGMPVIGPQGLVGRIHHVYGDYADVLLVTDPQSAIDVVISRTGGRGILTGLSRDDTYRAEIDYLERDTPVEVGDEITTSGLGSAFPAGVLVGTIAAIKSKEYGLYQEVEVTPSVDFSKLDSVLVLLAPPPPPDPDAGESKRSPQAYGVRPF